jgi:hypothetical protein
VRQNTINELRLVNVTSLSLLDHLPSHVLPSFCKEYPSGQVQLNDPSVFTHRSLKEHEFRVLSLHSLKSKNRKTKVIFSHVLRFQTKPIYECMYINHSFLQRSNTIPTQVL